MTTHSENGIHAMTNLDTMTYRANLLIVDDRKENLLALEGWLADFDVNIVKATSGNEALKKLLDQDFALVLMDVQMPGMDGFETAQLMRGTERTRQIPIIFVTAISKEDKHIFKGYEAGAVDYLFKPLDSHILRCKVAVFIRFYQQNKKLEQMVDELKKANATIKQLSIRDSLTGCFNRRYFNEQLPKEIQRAIRYDTEMSLVMIDIDHFKTVNDTHGHQCGDKVLKVFADRLSFQIRNNIDWVARYGGEEFVLVLPETSLSSAAEVAEKLRRTVAETLISTTADQELTISASFGVAARESVDMNPDETARKLLFIADERMYAAKTQGRNRVVTGT